MRPIKLILQKYVLIILFRILLPIYDTYGDVILACELILLGLTFGYAMLVPVALSTVFTVIACNYPAHEKSAPPLSKAAKSLLILAQLYIPYKAEMGTGGNGGEVPPS